MIVVVTKISTSQLQQITKSKRYFLNAPLSSVIPLHYLTKSEAKTTATPGGLETSDNDHVERTQS